MPLCCFLPNYGYGAGYGQTATLAGNLQNLARFIDYANSKGVQVGLWTQQNLMPVDPVHPQPSDRDFEQEIEAGVTALKTDVAWVGNGYSFGLNATQSAAAMIKKIKGDRLRPFIITLDGWAGTQNTAAVWTGDETGGQWEYIRFQIPTYIGEGLSGQPNVASDMDGIFGGKNRVVNTRDYQWKAFTPIQLNMDGWGYNPKNPFAFDERTTSLNRAYLKQKTMLMPYIYSIAAAASFAGKPMIRAMFLDYPAYSEAYTDLVKYQYLWGDYFLIAPIYQDTAADSAGNDIRNGIYLPDEKQIWIDYYTGKEYCGGQVINNFAAPLWKLP
ncbi:alpha-glucosidase, partial [Lactobacillus sp. XV13L]|nr:alpha-glucosidase [Lactobacillus sp. XV13L]